MATNIKEFGFVINDLHSQWVWNDIKEKRWESDTFRWVEKNAGADVFWDVGAWVGPFTLYGSKIFGEVVSFEPDYVAFNTLQNHVADNMLTNVTLVKRGLYKEETDVNFGFIFGKFGDSLSSINSDYISDKYRKSYVASAGLLANKDSLNIEYKIKTITIEKSIELYGYPDFLKIDVEGGEEYLIDDLIKYRFSTLCMAIHNGWMKNNAEFLEKINRFFVPLYNCYNASEEKTEIIKGDEECYFELKK